MLGIPPHVINGTEEQLKNWADAARKGARAFERTEFLDADVLLDNIQAQLDQAKNRELYLDVVMKRAGERGMLDGDMEQMLKEQLGLEKPEIEFTPKFVMPEDEDKPVMDIGFNVPEDAKQQLTDAIYGDEEALKLNVQLALGEGGSTLGQVGDDIGVEIMSGITTYFATNSIIVALWHRMVYDTGLFSQSLSQAGEGVWKNVEPGIFKAMKEGKYILEFARILAPEVATILQQQGHYGWQGGP
jgi:hypothetical protein